MVTSERIYNFFLFLFTNLSLNFMNRSIPCDLILAKQEEIYVLKPAVLLCFPQKYKVSGCSPVVNCAYSQLPHTNVQHVAYDQVSSFANCFHKNQLIFSLQTCLISLMYLTNERLRTLQLVIMSYFALDHEPSMAAFTVDMRSKLLLFF